jgi:hypothetical protein
LRGGSEKKRSRAGEGATKRLTREKIGRNVELVSFFLGGVEKWGVGCKATSVQKKKIAGGGGGVTKRLTREKK